MAEKSTVIVVRRVRKIQGGGHHGGSWKVAYADFVTAMMAFFLVMWLVGATTNKDRAAISEYFRNPSPLSGKSFSPAPGPNGPGGASTSMIKLGGTMDIPRGSGDDPFSKPDPDGHTPASREASAQDQAREHAQDQQRLEALMQALEEAIRQSIEGETTWLETQHALLRRALLQLQAAGAGNVPLAQAERTLRARRLLQDLHPARASTPRASPAFLSTGG